MRATRTLENICIGLRRVSLFRAMKKFLRLCLISAIAFPCALFARRDEGVLIYMNFDDAKHPLTNVSATEREASVFGMRTRAKVDDGKFVYSAVFANTNGKGYEPNDYSVNLGELDGYFVKSFSVAFWVKTADKNNPNRGMGAHQAMFSGNKDWTKPNSAGWAITAVNGKNFSVCVGGKQYNVGFPNLTDGKWHHVALVVDRKAGTLTCYGDGKAISSQKIPAGKIGSDLETLVGGSGSGAFAAPNSGNAIAMIDDYAIWTRALTAKEVSAMWDEGQGARVPEPSAFPLIFGLGALAITMLATRRRRHSIAQ